MLCFVYAADGSKYPHRDGDFAVWLSLFRICNMVFAHTFRIVCKQYANKFRSLIYLSVECVCVCVVFDSGIRNANVRYLNIATGDVYVNII